MALDKGRNNKQPVYTILASCMQERGGDDGLSRFRPCQKVGSVMQLVGLTVTRLQGMSTHECNSYLV